jgi:CheY-like chemotaxis protein
MLGKAFVEVEDITLPLMAEKMLSYETDWGNMRDVYVNVDKKRLVQVLLNLFSNAIKYTPEGGTITFTCKRTFLSEAAVPGVYFCVEDTGCGISEDFIGRIFEPFEQEYRYETGENAGTGLGLAISKNFVELMGGTLQVESKVGQGSKFFFTIPITFCTKREIVALEEEIKTEESANASLEGMRVLYVEDNRINREIGMAMLRDGGMIVEVCADGFEALERIRESEPFYYDVILMDIQMPRMSGLECCARIRKMEREDVKSVPILALTADVSDVIHIKSSRAGMNGCLTKPVDLLHLQRAIWKSLNEKE